MVVVGWNDTTSTVQSVKDSVGNTYSLAIGPTAATGMEQSIYYAANMPRGSNSGDGDVQPGGGLSGCAHSGVSRGDGAGCDGGASGSSASASSGAATTTSANEVIFGADIVATIDDGGGERLHLADHHRRRMETSPKTRS